MCFADGHMKLSGTECICTGESRERTRLLPWSWGLARSCEKYHRVLPDMEWVVPGELLPCTGRQELFWSGEQHKRVAAGSSR